MLRKSDVWRRQSRRRCGASPGADVGRASHGSFLVVMRALPRMQPTKGQQGQTSIATSIIALQHRNKHHSIATSIIALQHRNRHEKPAGARPSSRPQCPLRRRVPALRPPETHRMPLLSCEQFGSEASPRPATAARAAAAASPPFRACSAPSRPPPSLRGAPVVGTCTVGQSTRRFTTRVHSAVCESGCSGRPAL